MKIYLVRHGQTEDNIANISTGRCPWKLTPHGHNQAQYMGNYVRHYQLDHIYVSDLQRTKDTAQPLIHHHQTVPVTYTPQLRELTKWIYDGRPQTEGHEAVKQSWNHRYEFVYPQGESIEQLQQRGVQFFKDMYQQHQWESILAISHGWLITTFLLYALAKDFDNFRDHRVDNASISLVVYDGKQFHVEYSNQIDHLL